MKNKNHQRIHFREKPLRCKECLKTFSETKETTMCSFRREAFQTISSDILTAIPSFKNHKRTHSGNKPFSLKWTFRHIVDACLFVAVWRLNDDNYKLNPV